MLIRSSDQVPRVTALKRFPVPRNFGVSSEVAHRAGKTWPAPAGATRVKKFEIYRYDPDSGEQSAHRHLRSRSRRLRTDGPGRPNQDQERDRFDAHLPPLLPRGRLRLLRNEHRRHELAGLHAIYFGHTSPRRFIRSNHLSVIKDLVPDLTHLFAQYSLIEPWLQTTTPEAREGAASVP